MIRVNENYSKLKASYLFAEIAKRVQAFQAENPSKRVIKLGIGDVTEPLPAACIHAMHEAADELGNRDTFKGYPEYEGYAFIREAIAKNDFQARGANITAAEIFVSDGAKSDTANFQELFTADTRIAITDPVYPVYLDTNVMAGRTGAFEDGRYAGVTYLDSTPENNYIPAVPSHPVDLIYLCFPNNPTGATATRAQLEEWVAYAREHKALILFDAAYEAFIRDESIPHSIFEIPGARECAVEFRSFSKTAGFTGTRCAYTIIPQDLNIWDASGNPVNLHKLWYRRQATKFNGVSYPVQKAAAAIYTDEGKKQVRELTDFYLGNAKLIRNAMQQAGLSVVGGDNSPYIWINTGTDSWAFFDRLLKDAAVVCTPGAGFGKCGEGHIRISAFNSRQNVEEALERIRTVL